MSSLECLLRGHDDRIAREHGRLFLQCARCRRETPGWLLDSSPYAPPVRALTSTGARQLRGWLDHLGDVVAGKKGVGIWLQNPARHGDPSLRGK